MFRNSITAKLLLQLFAVSTLLLLIADDDGRSGERQIDLFRAANQAGDADDPFARWRFEWMRTRDPVTNQIPRGIRQRELAFAELIPAVEQVRLMRGIGQRELEWKERGPYNVGGRTRALAIDVSNESTILAGGVSGGMWRSTDSGANWTKTTKPEQLHSVTTIAQDPRSGKTDTWYYGTGEYLGNSASADGGSYSGDGIFKSTDGGLNWSPLSATVSNTPQVFDSFFDYIWRIRVSPVNGYVFAATYSRIYRSKDSGSSWGVSLAPSDAYASYADLAVSSAGVLYAVLSSGTNKSGVYRSADSGDNWTEITPTGFPASYRRLVLALASSNENVLYLLGDLGGEKPEDHILWKYVYASGDGSGTGGSWTDLSPSIPAYGGAVGDFNSQFGYDLVVEVKPDDEKTVYIGGTNLYMSTNGFADTSATSWVGGYSTENNISQYENHHPDQHSLVFLPSNAKVLFAGHDGGVSRTEDNTNSKMVWKSLNNGYSTTQFYHVSLEPSGTKKDLLMGGMQDNGTWSINSDDASSDWSAIGSGDGAYSAFAKKGDVFVFSSQNGDVMLNDYSNPFNWSIGYTWFGLTPKGASDMLFINPFILDPSDEDIIYYAGGQTVWRNNSIDMSNTANWELDSDLNYYVSTQWEQLSNTAVSGQISSLGASKANPSHRLYYGTSDGKVYRLEGANEGANTPTEVTGSTFPSEAYVSSIAVDPTDGDKALVTFSNYSVVSVWYTADAGTTWTDVSGNLEEKSDGTGAGPSVRTALILAYGEAPQYLLGTSTGLYSTTTLNGSSTQWAGEGSETIGNVVVDALAGRDSDGTIVVGTHGNGVFSSTLSTGSYPAFRISPVSLTASVREEGSAQKSVRISNTGDVGSTLSYTISWQYSSTGSSRASVVNRTKRAPSSRLRESVTRTAALSQQASRRAEEESIISYHGDLTYKWDSPDVNNIPEWGTRFTSTEKIQKLQGANFYWYDADGTPDVTIHVYGDNGGYPGTELGSVQVPWSSVKQQDWNYVDLSGLSLSFEAEEDFFLTYTVDNGSYNQLGLEILSDGGGQGVKRSYGKYQETWYKLVDLFQGGTDYEWGIQAKVNYSGSSEPSWLTVTPTSGAVGYNESDNITVGLNASGLTVGTYSADMMVTHNAAGSPDTVNISMTVVGSDEGTDDNLPPSAFDLVYPPDAATITLTRDNFLDTLYFAWDQSIDPEGEKVHYRRELTGDLPEYIRFIVPSGEGTTTNMYKIPYHHIEHYMHTAGVEEITGTWTIVATDGATDVYPDNGPFTLTIDGSKLGTADDSLIPESFALHQNYPNPFNPTTTIRYDLPEEAHVTLTVYDLMGKEITSLVSESQDTGVRTVRWDGTDASGRYVSAGVYLYRIRAGKFSETRKMVLLR